MDFLPEETDEILNIFREETEEIIQKLNNNLLQLENTPNDKEKLVFMFRDAHSLKGAARMIGFNNIQRLAHKIEDVLGLAKENKLHIDREITDVLYKATDLLSFLIENSVKIKKEYYTDDIQKYIENIDVLIYKRMKGQEPQSAEPLPAPENDLKEMSPRAVLAINGLFSEALLVGAKFSPENSTKYLETLFDTTKELEKLLKESGFASVDEQISSINSKISFVIENSNIMTESEIQELNSELFGASEDLNRIYQMLGEKTVDFRSLIESKLHPDENSPINIALPAQEEPEENNEQKLIKKVQFVKEKLEKLGVDLSEIPEINKVLNHIISKSEKSSVAHIEIGRAHV